MRSQVQSLIIIALLSASCRTTGRESAVEAAAPRKVDYTNIEFYTKLADIPGYTCQTGTPFPFKNEFVRHIPEGTDFPFGPSTFRAPTNIMDHKKSDVRLDICFDDMTSQATLQRIVFGGYALLVSASADGKTKYFFNVVTPPTQADAAELGKMLFNSSSTYDLTIPLSSDATNSALKVKAWTIKEQQLVSISTRKDTGASKSEIDSHFVFTLSEGDGLVEVGEQAECDGGGHAVFKNFTIETAKFSAKRCNKINTAGTENYDIVEFSVTDDSPDLDPNVRGKKFTIGKSGINDAFKNIINHHNVCDSFVLTLPHATYAATNAPFGETRQGCPASVVVPGAPTRDESDQSESFYYSVKYGTAALQQYAEPCGKSYQTSCTGTKKP